MASSYSLYGGGDRGAGGKIRRERKQPPPKPYDRPIRNNNNGGWISRIVGGATRFLPYFFSSSLNHDDGSAEVEQNTADHHANGCLDLLVPKSSGEVGPSEAEGKSELHIYDKDKQDNMRDGGVDPREAKGKSKLHVFDKDRQDAVRNHSNSQQLDIEQLIKGKTFSKEQIDRLMEILRARVVDTQSEQLPSVSAVEEPERTEKLLEKQTASIDKKEELDKFKWTSAANPRTSVSDNLIDLELLVVQGAIGASPIDIARAYMGSRTAEAGLTPIGSISRSEKLPLTNEFSTKSLMASPMPKSSIFWPGAITRDQDYLTPQSQKSGYGFQSFPRTPYSRTTYTKSKSRLNPLRNDAERFPSIPSVPFQPSRTPMYGKSMSSVDEGSNGSGGPIRRMRNKLTSATPARESRFSNTPSRSPWAKESSSDSLLKKNNAPATFSTPNVKELGSKPQSSEVPISSVHPHSSKLARQILEQLDRPVTLKEKSHELKLAVEWKSLSHSISSPPELNNNKAVVADAVLGAQTKDGNNVLDRTEAASGAGRGILLDSMISPDKTSNVFGTNIWPSQSIQKFDSQTKNPDQAINSNQPKGTSQSWFVGSTQRKGPVTSNNSPGHESQNTQRKPILPSISVDKPGLKPLFSSETNVGFTFPVTTKSSIFAEPPTPSIMPSSSTSSPQESQQSKLSSDSTITFGNKITIAPPVVLPSSTSNVSINNDASIPKFKFGSDKSRLSFALDGNDAVSASDAGIPKYKFGSGEKRLNFGSIDTDAVFC